MPALALARPTFRTQTRIDIHPRAQLTADDALLKRVVASLEKPKPHRRPHLSFIDPRVHTEYVDSHDHHEEPNELDALSDRMVDSLACRRLARANPRFRKLVESKRLESLALLLDVADDMVVRLVEPRREWEGLFAVEGIEGVRHLIEEAMPHLPAAGGYPRLLETVEDGTPIYHSPFALYADLDSLLECADPIWGSLSPRSFPLVDGMPTAYLGEGPFEQSWESGRMFPGLKAKVTPIFRLEDF